MFLAFIVRSGAGVNLLSSPANTNGKSTSRQQGHQTCSADGNGSSSQSRNRRWNLGFAGSHCHTPRCGTQRRMGHDTPRRLIEACRIRVVCDTLDDRHAISCNRVV